MNFEHLSRYEIIMTVAQTFWDMFLIVIFSLALSVAIAWVMAVFDPSPE